MAPMDQSLAPTDGLAVPAPTTRAATLPAATSSAVSSPQPSPAPAGAIVSTSTSSSAVPGRPTTSSSTTSLDHVAVSEPVHGADTPAVDVIVVDDGDAPPSGAPASPGRTSARLRAKKAARAVRAATRKIKRVGPVDVMEFAEASRKKRKAGTAAAPSAPPVQITTTEFPPASSPNPPTSTLAATADQELPCGEDVVHPTIDGDQRTSSDVCTTAVSAATSTPADAALRQHARPPQASEFNLDEFAQNFTTQVPAPPSAVPRPSLADQVDQLFQMFFDLRRELQVAATERQGQPSQLPTLPAGTAVTVDAPVVSAAATTGTLPQHASSPWTLALTSNPSDLPPPAICQLRCSSFPLPRVRVKGEYHPPQAHQLAAHRMFRDLNSDEGRWLCPMSFVLHVRELECVRFDAPPAVLMAVFSGRLGSRGLTVMHFRPQPELEQLQRGSTNANFSADFGAGATLPATDARCATYEDLLAAVGGLISFGDALWYDHVRRLLSRLKRFILSNMERDNNTPERVRLTLMFANQFLGRALAHLLVDSPHWWRNFNEAVRAVDYHSPDWQAALNGLALRWASSTPLLSTEPQQGPYSRTHAAQPRRGPATCTPIMPEYIRRQVPHDDDGREPCLRFLAGGMCYGGSTDRCAHHRRTHRWNGRLPRDLQEFIDRNYGHDRRQHSRNHRA